MGFRETLSQNRRSALIGGALLLGVGAVSAIYQLVTYDPSQPATTHSTGSEDDEEAPPMPGRSDAASALESDERMMRDREARFREHEEAVRAEERSEKAATRVALP